MRALQLSFFVDAQRRPGARLLDEWHAMVDIARAARVAGVEVSVVQAHWREELDMRNGIPFHFLAADEPGAPFAKSAGLARLLAGFRPDVIHVHGLSFWREVLVLRTCVPGLPILLQDHADGVPRIWRRGSWRRGLAAANGLAFCARAQAEPFRAAAMLASHLQIFEIPESTSTFAPGDREAARAATGLHGDPCVLWVGHLDANKDPLTVLEGFSKVAADVPAMRLWCCFGSAPLLPRVEARIAADPVLRERVHLLGRVAHARVEQLMHAADIFVLGSHREGSSFALIEALATGLTPVVTDIPSLRALTGDGAVGALWRAGSAGDFAAALRRVATAPRDRPAVREFFDAGLSTSAMGGKLRDAYQALVTANVESRRLGNR